MDPDDRDRLVRSAAGLEHVGLRLGAEVDAVHRVIFHGEHPVTGESLGQRMGKDGIAGFGMTFSAPKSVSLWALASPEVAGQVEPPRPPPCRRA